MSNSEDRKKYNPKEGKHAPEVNKPETKRWPYFNKRNLAKDAEGVKAGVHTSAMSIAKSYGVFMPVLWCTAEEKFKKVAWAWNNPYFRMSFLTMAVDEVGFQLWNAVYHAHDGKAKEKKADEALARYQKEMR